MVAPADRLGAVFSESRRGWAGWPAGHPGAVRKTCGDDRVRFVRYLRCGAACVMGADGAVLYVRLADGRAVHASPGRVIRRAVDAPRGGVAIQFGSAEHDGGGTQQLRVYDPTGRLASVLDFAQGCAAAIYTEYKNRKVYRLHRDPRGSVRVTASWSLPAEDGGAAG
ncbi:MAG: hypothetical protein AAGA92_01685 [Planctomycetota bacterium]